MLPDDQNSVHTLITNLHFVYFFVKGSDYAIPAKMGFIPFKTNHKVCKFFINVFSHFIKLAIQIFIPDHYSILAVNSKKCLKVLSFMNKVFSV